MKKKIRKGIFFIEKMLEIFSFFGYESDDFVIGIEIPILNSKEVFFSNFNL